MSPGRPSQFDQAIADEFLERISSGETIAAICLDQNMPTVNTLYAWKGGKRGADPSFADAYLRARYLQADSLASEIIDIADNADDSAVTAAKLAVAALGSDATHGEKRRAHFFAKKRTIEAIKLMIESRKWFAARRHPSNWGEKVTHEITGNIDKPVMIDFGKLTTAQLERVATMERELRGGSVGTMSTEMKRLPLETTQEENSL